MNVRGDSRFSDYVGREARTAERSRRRQYFGRQAALALLLPLLLLWWLGPLPPLLWDMKLYDRLLAYRPAVAQDRTLIVSVDEQSLRALGPWPWPRDVHARLLRQLAAASPQAVVLGVNLETPTNGADDALLVSALRLVPTFLAVRSYGAVALPGATVSYRLPDRRFLEAARGVGHADLESSTDGLARFIGLYSEHAGPLPYVGVLVGPSGDISRALGRRQNLKIGVRHAGDASEHPTVSYLSVLQGGVPAELIKGRIVIVGSSAASGLDEEVWVPVAGGAARVTAADVHADAIESLASGRAIAVAGPLTTYVCVAAMIWATFIAFSASSRWTPLIGLGIAMFAVSASAVLLLLFRIWMPPSLSVLGIFGAYVLWSWLRLQAVVDFLRARIVSLSRMPAGEFEADLPLLPSRLHSVDWHVAALDQAISRMARLQALLGESLQQMPVAVVMCREEGVIVRANSQAASLLHPSMPDAQALAGVRLPAIVAELSTHADDARPAPAGRHWAKALDQEYLTPAGRLFRVDATLLDDGGSLTVEVWIVVLNELTQQRKAERDRSAWLRFLSHDMRSPQINLLCMIDLYGMNRLPIADVLAGVTREAQRTLQLTEGFIDAAEGRTRESGFAVASIATVLAEAVEQAFAYAATRRVTLSLRYTEHRHALIWTDRLMLVRAMVNLLENAARHSDPVSTVHLCVAVDAADEVVVMIRDEGHGMSPMQFAGLLDDAPARAWLGDVEREARLLDIFPEAPRHGLGFPGVRRAVDAHEGWITGWSAPMAGTTFLIGLPLHA
jgi:CHASE2 domain-containing sensor protein/nitrogen-specific signal transduction histidine kinase